MNLHSRPILTLLFLTCALSQAQGQSPSAFADTNLYDAALNRLFQHVVQPKAPEFQLRYTYCDAGEMQIVVHRLADSGFLLNIWHVPAGVPNIWNQLAQIAEFKAPAMTADTAARSIKVSRKNIEVRNSTALAKLLDGSVSISIPVLDQNTIVLDGMVYGLAVRSISEEMSLTLQGPQHSEESKNPVIRWMGQVRSMVELELRRQP